MKAKFSYVDLVDTVHHQISDVEDYGWKSYGVGMLIAEMKRHNGSPLGSCVFHPGTLAVAEASFDVGLFEGPAYRWRDPDLIAHHDEDAWDRGIDPDIAWDDVEFTDVQEYSEFLRLLKEEYQNDGPEEILCFFG